MKRETKIVITLGTALSLGLAAAAVGAHPSGFGGGWSGGHMGGYGMGSELTGRAGPGNGTGAGYGMQGGGMGYGRGPQAMFDVYSGGADDGFAAMKDHYQTLTREQKSVADQRFGGFGPGRTQGHRGGPRGYSR